MLVNSKQRIIAISSIIIFVFLLLCSRTGYLALVKGNELSTLTEQQYTVLEPSSNINYSLRDYNGKELLSFISKYYFVLDKNSFLKNNFNTDVSTVKSLIYILRNYNQSYDLLDLTSDTKNQKLYFNIDEETFNKVKEIHGVKGVYCFKKTDIKIFSSVAYKACKIY